MNCKQGDLAVVVDPGPWFNTLGCFCRVTTGGIGMFSGEYVWNFVDATGALAEHEGKQIKDSHLRPIRDTDGQDETLAWKDVPAKEVA